MKTRTLWLLEVVTVLGGLIITQMIVNLFFNGITATRIMDIAWFVLFFSVTSLAGRARRKRLDTLWQLADQAGIGPAELKQRSGRYGEIDWALSRPEKRQFLPSDQVVSRLVRQLQS